MESRRSTDGITLQKVAIMATLLITLLGALSLVGSTVFAKIEDVKKLEHQVIDMDKIQIRNSTKLDNIESGIKDIKEMIRK